MRVEEDVRCAAVKTLDRCPQQFTTGHGEHHGQAMVTAATILLILGDDHGPGRGPSMVNPFTRCLSFCFLFCFFF